MTVLLDRTLDFFAANLPSARALAIGGPLGLLWSLGALWLAGTLKRRGVRTGYTRKIFHFLIFGTAAVLHWLLGTPAVCLFGGMCSLVVFYAVARGSGHRLYEAMARERDEPHRTFFILVPYFTTLAGGLVANILFGPFALAGYLVAGLGDAIGEPVGARFGRHRYRVPSRASVPATRSLEGSAAVFLMSAAALVLAAAASPHIALGSFGLLKLAAIAAAAALAEALSPHGWDNATMQIVPAALAGLWLA
jgi:phytol kinase